MKLAAAISMLAASVPFVAAWNVHVRSSDDLIDVGDLDLYKNTWQAIYSASGNKDAVTIGPPPLDARGGACQVDNNADRRVTLTIEGVWDDVGGKNHLGRDAMIEAGWAALQRLADANAYNVWKNCCKDSLGSSCPYNGRLCGVTTSCGCSDPSMICHASGKGHKVPSLLNVYLTHNGAATGNHLRMTFKSNAVEQKGGCGKVEAIAKGLASFLFPGPVANLVGTGIDVQCA